MATMQDLVQTMLQGQQLLLAKRAQEVSEARSKSDRLVQLAALAEGIAQPELREALVDVGVREQLGDRATIKGILDNLAPGSGVLQRFLGMAGYGEQGPGEQKETRRTAGSKEATGENPAQAAQFNLLESMFKIGKADLSTNQPFARDLARTMLVKQIAGVTPGAFALDQAMANLPQPMLARGAEREIGEIMTARDIANVGVQQMGLATQQGIAEAEIAARKWIAQLQADTESLISRANREAQKGALGQGTLTALMDNMRTALTTLQQKKATMSQDEINSTGTIFNSSIRAINALTGSHIAPLPFKMVKDPRTGLQVELIDPDAITQSFSSQMWNAITTAVRQAGSR